MHSVKVFPSDFSECLTLFGRCCCNLFHLGLQVFSVQFFEIKFKTQVQQRNRQHTNKDLNEKTTFKGSDPVSDTAPWWQSTAQFSISLTKQVTSKKQFPSFQVVNHIRIIQASKAGGDKTWFTWLAVYFRGRGFPKTRKSNPATKHKLCQSNRGFLKKQLPRKQHGAIYTSIRT